MNFFVQQGECMVNIEHIAVVTRQREKIGLFCPLRKEHIPKLHLSLLRHHLSASYGNVAFEELGMVRASPATLQGTSLGLLQFL